MPPEGAVSATGPATARPRDGDRAAPRPAAARPASAHPVPCRGGLFTPRPLPLWVPVLLFVVLGALWELGSRTGVISSIVLPAPSAVLGALGDLVETGALWRHLGASLQRLVIGWSTGTVAGVALGLLIGLLPLARATFGPLVSALFPVPKIALLPLFVIWFGIGEGSKVATIFFGTFFPTVISTYGGVDGVDRTLVRMGRSFGLSRASLVRKIILPGALPAILSGMRISVAIAIILLVAAEMIGAEHGIGAYILLAGALFATDQLIAGVAMLSALGLAAGWLLGRLERVLLRWR